MITKIELRKIPMGYIQTESGTQDVFNEDLQVLLGDWGENGTMRQIGYVWFNPRRFISFDCIRGATESDQATVKRLVEEETELEFDKVTQPPNEPDDEEEDDADDDC